MLKFIKFFQGYLYVVIYGYSPERFLNLCSNQNIVLWELMPTDDGYSFCISLKAFRRLKPLLKKTGTRIRIQKRCGLPFLLFRYRKHRFFLFGIFCALAVLIAMSQFIWKVEITGNSFYSNQVLTEFLDESGVGYGVLKQKIDCSDIQTMLRKQFDDITWVSARISGTRLYLIIQERIGQTTDTVADEEAPADLVSDCDGTVVSITTRRGTPQVAQGDKVKKGDLLVLGTVDIMDDNGEKSGSHYCRADADVKIRTKLPYKNTFSRTYEKMEETGKKRYQCTLKFHNYQFQLGRKAPGSDGWDKATDFYPIKVGEDFYLPAELYITRFEQYQKRRYTYTEEEIKKKAEEELTRYCKKLEENGIQILANSVMIDKNKTDISVKGKLDAVIKADKFQDITPEKMQEGIEKDGIDAADDGHSD